MRDRSGKLLYQRQTGLGSCARDRKQRAGIAERGEKEPELVELPIGLLRIKGMGDF